MQGKMNIVGINMYINLTSQACYSDIGQGGIRINMCLLVTDSAFGDFQQGFLGKTVVLKDNVKRKQLHLTSPWSESSDGA